MLDVWLPFHAALADGVSNDGLRLVVAAGAAATVAMKAMRGRASFLGDRSIGHMDPGARSSQLMIEAFLDGLDGRR